MSKLSHIVVLVTALASVFAVTSSTAGAVTWTNTGGTAFHATGGPGTLAVTGSGGTNNFSCTTSTATGNVPSGVFTSVTGTATFTSCLMAGSPMHFNCSFTLTPLSQTATIPAVTTVSADVTCTAYLLPSTPICHIHGATPGHYSNPNTTTGTAARLTLTPSNTLQVAHANGTSSCSAWLGTFTSSVGHLTEQTITLTGAAASQPFIVRDA